MSDRTVFKALNEVQKELASIGIGKNQKNDFDGYQYRGIDDVLNTLGPILAKHGVLIIPSVESSETRQVPTKNGGTQNHTKMTVNYTLYDVHGDHVTHSAQGEAFDRGDKSVNKAMTAAYKYFMFQSFCIPMVGNDADSDSHEVSDTTEVDHMEAVRDLMPSIMAIKESISSGDYSAGQEAWIELTDQEKTSLWKAPSKGGIFSTIERNAMKTTEFKNGEMAA